MKPMAEDNPPWPSPTIGQVIFERINPIIIQRLCSKPLQSVQQRLPPKFVLQKDVWKDGGRNLQGRSIDSEDYSRPEVSRTEFAVFDMRRIDKRGDGASAMFR